MIAHKIVLLLPVLLSVVSASAALRPRANATTTSYPFPVQSPGTSNYPFTVEIAGGVARTDNDWLDGFAIDVISPTAYNMTVDINLKPAPAMVVSDMGGSPWILAQNYSYKITCPGKDLIGKIEIPYYPEALKAVGIDYTNTYVGKLSTDGTYWIVDSTLRNVHASENKTRVLKMTDMHGEYILLGRKTVDKGDWLIQYGYYPFQETRTLNITKGAGLQNGIFIDGFAMAVESKNASLAINANMVITNATSSFGAGYKPLTPYSYLVNSTVIGGTAKPAIRAQVTLPYTEYMLSSTALKENLLAIAWQKPGSTVFDKVQQTQTIDTRAQTVTAYGLNYVDGVFALVGY